jgi:hypothetical protein
MDGRLRKCGWSSLAHWRSRWSHLRVPRLPGMVVNRAPVLIVLALVVGVARREAELELANGDAVFEEIELLG